MVEAITNAAKDFAAAALDIIEWAWRKLGAPRG